MLDADEVYTATSLLKIKTTLKNAQDGILGYRLNSYNFINGFTKWFNGNYMRVYKVTPQAKFFMDNDCAWPDKQGTVSIIPGYSFYHYNYVKLNKDAFWRKMAYQNYQDPTFNQRVLPQYGYDDLKKIYKIPNDISIYNFSGKHPAIMKKHFYFENNIYNDTDISFLKE